MHKLIRFFNTVKYLKFTQIYYQIFYKLRSVFRSRRGFNYLLSTPSQTYPLKLEESIVLAPSNDHHSFIFLNQSYRFIGSINWNYSKFGKLWTYNLTYFDFLQQDGMTKRTGEALIHDFIDQMEVIKDGLEPFPISLRGINWIKFLSQHKVKNHKINDSLLAQYYILIDNLEYHLLGNHLLENGFSLLFGAYYFQDKRLYNKAKTILYNELNEQILDDGGHFELSPMYHQLMLFRVLDCINLVKNNSYNKHELLSFLEEKAVLMLGWINTMTFKNGAIPLFNDSANGIAPTTAQLNNYALKLDSKFKIQNPKLKDSGYRKITKPCYECIVDVGNIGPNYIPGHAHADTFNFELYVDNKPFIVDTGISTYEKNELRQKERGTASHNTVTINDTNQSQVWDGFRVANRAYITQLEENEKGLKATHNGYQKRFNILHKREFVFKENSIHIIDKIDSDKNHKAVARLHFHPEINEEMIKDRIIVKNSNFKSGSYQIHHYNYAPEFNKQVEAKMIEIPFFQSLEVEIII